MVKEPITGYEYADWVHAGRKPVPSISKEPITRCDQMRELHAYEISVTHPENDDVLCITIDSDSESSTNGQLVTDPLIRRALECVTYEHFQRYERVHALGCVFTRYREALVIK